MQDDLFTDAELSTPLAEGDFVSMDDIRRVWWHTLQRGSFLIYSAT